MRLSKVLLSSLVLAFAGLLISGCSTTNDTRPGDTVVLGGLYSSEKGVFDQQTATGIPVNSDKPSPKKEMSGDKVSILWGLITYRDQ